MSFYDLWKKWVENGAWIRTKDGREMPMKQFWEEYYTKEIVDEFIEAYKDEKKDD